LKKKKQIRPVPRRWSISKRFEDHYHVEGPDPFFVVAILTF